MSDKYPWHFYFRVIPELVKKKEARDAELKKKLNEERAKAKDVRKKNQEKYMTRGKKIYETRIKAKKELIEAKRKARHAGNYYVPSEAKVAFIIRIKG